MLSFNLWGVSHSGTETGRIDYRSTLITKAPPLKKGFAMSESSRRIDSKEMHASDYPALAARIKQKPQAMTTADRLTRTLRWSTGDIVAGRYRYKLYRFLADHVPAIGACIWTWSRLAGAPGRFTIRGNNNETVSRRAQERLDHLADRLYTNPLGSRVGLPTMITDMTTSLFRDGLIGGFVTVCSDASSVDRFIPIDPIHISVNVDRTPSRIFLEVDDRRIDVYRPDFYLITLSDSPASPLGRSILSAVPFVSYIEQQLVSDMRRASHNAGFHRLHVKITPPERIGGESDRTYTERINRYFDTTVEMIRSCEIDDNPVTWDNVEVQYIGPTHSRDIANSWFMSHRAMIEEICAGTNLAPFMLGYSYGATTTWADFKFDIVMRQVRSVQSQLARFLSWIGDIELALGGFDCRCTYQFDNSMSYRAADEVKTQSGVIDNVLKLYQAGLIDEETARAQACRIL